MIQIHSLQNMIYFDEGYIPTIIHITNVVIRNKNRLARVITWDQIRAVINEYFTTREGILNIMEGCLDAGLINLMKLYCKS